MSKKYKKTKEELDLLSYEEILEKVRWPILRNSKDWNIKNSEDRRYIEELEIYCDIRFKERALNTAKRVLYSLDNGTEAIKNDLESIKAETAERFYQFLINGKLKALGELVYIKELILPVKSNKNE